MGISPENLKNWDRARIATDIVFINPNDSQTVDHRLKIVNRISIREIHDFVPYGGITEWNQGYIEKPPQYSFTIGIPATSKSCRLLRALHTSGTSFNLQVSDAAVAGSSSTEQEFALIKEALIECKLVGKEMTIVIADLPIIVFNGLALRKSYTDGEATTSLNGDAYTTEPAKLFGSGAPIPNSVNLFSESWS